MDICARISSSVRHWSEKRQILAARKCTPLDAAELWVILARLDAAEDEKIRGELDRELHKKIAKIADNPMVYSVLAAADQLTENIVSGTRDYIMKKNNSVREVDDSIIGWLRQSSTEMQNRRNDVCPNIWIRLNVIWKKCKKNPEKFWAFLQDKLI